MKVKGIKRTPQQKEWVKVIEKEEHKYITIVVSRQSGKTTLLSNLICKYGIETPNQVLLWVSPTFSQCRKVSDDIYKAIKDSNLVQSYNRSNYELVLTNGSKMLFRSTEREQNLRGYSCDYIFCDEAAYFANNVYDEILRPMILVKGKKLIMASTPKNKNFFYNLHLRGLSPEYPTYATIQASSYMNTLISQDEVLEAKKTLPDHIFKAEYLAEFVDDGGTVFTDIDRYCILEEYGQRKGKLYAGLDLGRAEDYTVLTILNEDGEVVDIYRDRQKPWEILVSNILVYLRKYQPILQVEINSIGDVIYEMLKKKYSKTYPFQTNTHSKQNIIEDLILGLNLGKISLPSKTLNEDLYNELQTFTYTYSPSTRNVKYEGKKGFYDDMIMSLAIGYNTMKSKQTSGTYSFR